MATTMRRGFGQGKTALASLLLASLVVLLLLGPPPARAFRPAAGPPTPLRRPPLPLATRSRWATAGDSKTVPPLLPSRAALAPLYARLDLDEDTATTSSSSTANAKKKKSKAAREEEVIDYRRPKALKEPQQQAATAMASSARQQEQPSELWVLGESLRLVLSRAFLDPFLDPPPIENYAQLIGDLSVILSFRSLEDTLLTPIATLDIAASPDMIARGLTTYADPLNAAAHIYSVVADGMTLGLFWLYAILWNGAEAVDMGTARSFTLTTLNVFKAWLALCNIRLAVLLFQALVEGEGVDLPHAQMELSALFITMLGWRWLNVAVFKKFHDP